MEKELAMVKIFPYLKLVQNFILLKNLDKYKSE